MKKRLFGLLLSTLMLLPLLSSCTHSASPEEKEVPIYTLYTIADAKPEAVRAVELALNRILYYRIGVCVDIVTVSEDKYNDLINSKIAEMDAKEAAKKTKNTSSSASSADSNYVMSYNGVLSGEKVISMLEEGKDVHPRENRFDIFLVRGFENYFELATKGKLASLSEKLTSEAKLLKDYIHESMLTAATINKKIYGIPANGAVGDYKYIVFDAELLKKYNLDAKTMVSLEDLQEYLQLIKEKEPDVVPLKSTVDTKDCSYMFEDGFPAYVDDSNTVKSTYEDKDAPSYYAMISRYRALGYCANASGSNDGRFAVTFVSGDESTINSLSEKNGKKYEFNVYQNPVATNDTAVRNIYCVSKSVVSNDITGVAKLLKEIYTDKDIQNIFTYGIEGTNYVLDDNGQVKKLNDDYKINPDYTGNKFLTYTLAGDDPQKWDKIKKQNQVSTASKSLGFEIVPKTVDYTDEKGNKVLVYEPDYREILEKVTAKYYSKFLDGSIVQADMKTLQADSEKAVMEELKEELKKTYESNISAEYTATVKKQITSSAAAAQLKKEATDTVMNELISSVKNTLQTELTKKYKKELTGASDEEIQAKVDAELTDDYVNQHLYDDKTKEEVEADINDAYESAITDQVSTKVSDYLASSAYENAVNSAVNSAKFNQDIKDLYAKSGTDLVNKQIDKTIAESIQKASEEMIKEYNAEIDTALNKFADDYIKLNDKKSKDEIFAEIGYYKKAGSSSDSTTSGDTASAATSSKASSKDDKVTYEPAYDSCFKFVFTEKIQKPYNILYPVKTSK